MSSADIKAGAAFVEVYVNNSRLVRGLKAAQRKLRGFEASVTALGKKMMMASGLMSLPFVAGAKVFADFEQQMANVSTMLDEPAKYMDQFRAGVQKMAIEFGESTETLAKGLYDILSASVAPEKALNVLAVSAKAAKAGMTDTGVAADAITTILNAYGLSADRAGEVSDLLFSIVKRGKTTFAELAPSIGMVATTAATAGVSTEELGAALATMTRNGVKTDNAITAVQAIISSFLKPAAEASEYARSLGFEMSVATLQAEGLEGVFKKISHLPPDAIAKLFPNVRALRGVLPALKNMQGFAGDLAAMANRAGATDTAFAKMSKTLAMTGAKLRETAKAMLAAIGESLANDITKAANAISKMLGRVTDWVKANKTLVATIAKIVIVVGVAGTALFALGMMTKLVLISISGFIGVFSLFTGGVKLLGSLAGAVLMPFRLLGKTFGVVGKSMGIVSFIALGMGKGLLSVGRGLKGVGAGFLSSAASINILKTPLKLVTGAFAAAKKSVLWFIAPFDELINKTILAAVWSAKFQTPLKQIGVVSTSSSTALATLNTSLASVSKSTKLATIGTTILSARFLRCNPISRGAGSAIKLLLTPLKLLGTVAKVAGGLLFSLFLRPVAMGLFVLKAFGAVIAGLFSPIGLVVAAIAAIGVVLYKSTGVGRKALAWLSGKFTALKEMACQAWQGIGKALAAGDIALAGKILWLSLKLVFQAGINELMKLWIDFKTSVLSVWVELKAGVQKLWQELWFMLKEIAIKTGLAEPILKTFHSLESGWQTMTQFFSRLWFDMCSGVMKAWNRVSRGVKSVQSKMSEIVVDVMAYFDESLDANEMKKMVRDQFSGEQKQLDNDLKKLDKDRAEQKKKLEKDQAEEQKKLEEKQAGRLAELERQKAIGNKGRRAEKDEAQANIDATKKTDLAALEAQATSDLAASAAELKKARDEWKAAIGEAATSKSGKAGSYNLSSEAKYDEVKGQLQGAAPAIDKATNSVGTFSAQFAGRMTSGTAAARTADAVEALLEEQRRANRKQQSGYQKFTAQGASSPL